MKPSTALSSALFAALAKGAALIKRQSVATCYGDQGPNLNDCKLLEHLYHPNRSHWIGDSLIALLGWTGTSTDQIEPGKLFKKNSCSFKTLLTCTVDPSGGISFFDDHHALNCEIGIGWNDPNNRLAITTSSLLPYINIIKDKCIVPSQAGGYSDSVDDNWTVRITNDPQYNPPSKQRRQAAGDVSTQ